MTSGVPQGSLLGTLLFLLFADDLSNAVETSRVACYADDTKVFKSIDSIIDCNILQSDLNNLVSWSESSGLIFNQSRCKYHCITRKRLPVQPTYTINETPLELATQRKTLESGCQAILPRTNKYPNSVRKPTNSLGLCAEFLGTSKAPKRVVHFTFLSSGAISATQPKYGCHSPLAYESELKTRSAVQQN